MTRPRSVSDLAFRALVMCIEFVRPSFCNFNRTEEKSYSTRKIKSIEFAGGIFALVYKFDS